MKVITGFQKAALFTLFVLISFTVSAVELDTDKLKFSPFDDGYFSAYGAEGLEKGLFAVKLNMKFQPDLLASYDAEGKKVRDIVGNQLLADLAFSYSVVKWFDAALVLPIVMWQGGDGWDNSDSLPSGGIGDIRLIPRFQILNLKDGLFAISIIPELTFPTGQAVHSAMGNSNVTFKPVIALGSESEWVGFTTNFFYQVLEKQTYVNSVFDDEFGVKVAMNGHVVPEMLDIIAEFKAVTSIESPFDNKAVDHIEFGGGVTFKTPVSFDISAGAFGGFGSAVGVPKYRIALGLSWNMNFLKKDKKPKEKKGEPVKIEKPKQEPAKKVEKPVKEVEKKAPEKKEPVKVEKKAEEKTPVKKEEPEKVKKPVEKKKQKKEIVIKRRPKKAKTGKKLQTVVRFDPNTDYISDTLEIEKIAMLLSRNFTLKVRVEGHCDDTENKIIAKHRAQKVMKVLIKNGVEPNRIKIDSRGSSEPVSKGDTDLDRAKNRRVEFYIITN